MIKKFAATLIAGGLIVGVAALPATADHQSDQVCPYHPDNGDMKFEAEEDELDDVVLDEGTEFCVKGGQEKVFDTADGETTLIVYLDNKNDKGNLRSVSHYVIYVSEEPPVTTTTEPPVTTTTEPPVTTTTEPPPTTTTTEPPPTTITEPTPVPETPDPVSEPQQLTSLPHTGLSETLAWTGAGIGGLGLLLLLITAVTRRLDNNN